jgi:hypothetical protein
MPSTETYYSVKRDLLQCKKRPIGSAHNNNAVVLVIDPVHACQQLVQSLFALIVAH